MHTLFSLLSLLMFHVEASQINRHTLNILSTTIRNVSARASQKHSKFGLVNFKWNSNGNVRQIIFRNFSFLRARAHTLLLSPFLSLCVSLNISVENITKKITACSSTNIILLEFHHQMKHYGKIMAIIWTARNGGNPAEEIPNDELWSSLE